MGIIFDTEIMPIYNVQNTRYLVVITFVLECVQLTMGRPCKGDKPLSEGERSKAYRDRKKGEKSEEWKEMRKEVKKKSFDSLSKEQKDEINILINFLHYWMVAASENKCFVHVYFSHNQVITILGEFVYWWMPCLSWTEFQ